MSLAQVDISGYWEPDNIAAHTPVDRALFDACSQQGFVIVRGHGVCSTVDRALAATAAGLLARPLKLRSRRCRYPDI